MEFSRLRRSLRAYGANLSSAWRRRLERVLQTTSVLLYSLMFVCVPFLFTYLCARLLLTSYVYLSMGYLVWMVYDVAMEKTSARGGRRWPRLRQAACWRYMRDFFPVSLVKTAPLDPANNYLMGYHPHGIMGCGAFCNFCTEATGFSDLYPGIRPTMLTLKANFLWPLLRGFLLWMGLCDASKESIQWIFTRQGAGNAAILVVGGAEEALEAHPGRYVVILKRRKGFIRQALKTGAWLVPMYSFGEQDVFRQTHNPPGSLLRRIQGKVKDVTGFAPPMFHGGGFLTESFGLVPYRKPINTVVGAPIPVTRCSDPAPDTVDRLHQHYMDQLTALFDLHKTRYGVAADTPLVMV